MGTIYVHMDFLKELKLDASAPVVTPSVPNATLGETPGENPAVTPGMLVVEDVTNNNTHFLQDVFGVYSRKLNKVRTPWDICRKIGSKELPELPLFKVDK
jgi:hypothetical protein